MRISRFDRVMSNVPQLVDLRSWDELVQHVGKHRFDYEAKDSVPLISPAEYLPGQIRRAQNVVRVHFGALDLDGISDADMDRIVEKCTNDGLAFLLYTTWSHPRRPNCARLFFPFSRPVERTEWASFWPRMRARFFNLPDEKCSDASRIFYYPSAPAGTEAEAVLHAQAGAPLDVDALMREAMTGDAGGGLPRFRLQNNAFNAWIRGISSSSGQRKQWTKSVGMLVIAGEPMAQQGERDNTIFRFVGEMVEQFPHATAESMLEVLRPSVRRMEFDIDVVLDKIKRAQSQLDQERAAEVTNEQVGLKNRIKAAFGTDRESPYSPDEIRAFAELMHVTIDEFKQMWIVQKDTTFFFFVDGQYRGPYTKAEMERQARDLLSPASSAGVEVMIATKTGIRPKTKEELVLDYGTIADHIVLDMTAQRSLFSFKDRTLTEAPCPRRPVEPEPSARVAEWLRLLAGPAQHDVLLDWIASATKLDQPCSALYLEGEPGAGKTLLACGLAAIWSEDGPTPLEDAFSAFNQSMLRCPVVLADEAMPTDFSGRMRSTGYLRQFVQARTRTLHRKYVPDSTLRGCMRLILAANHKDMISTSEHLTVQDIQAIVDRVLHIHVNKDPQVYLDSLTPKIGPEEIAAHALHLAETRRVESTHRFLVTGTQTDLHRRLTTGTGLRSAVCHWIVSYLHEPQKIDTTRSLLVRKDKGQVLVASRGLVRHWEVFPTNQDPPTMGPLSRALAGLSTGKRLLKAGDARPTWYWVIDTSNLVSWAEDTGYADRDQITELLRQDTAATTESN